MIYWNEYNDYKILEDDSLTNLAKKYNTKLVRNDSLPKETRDWFNFAHISSRKHGFNVVYEACFIYYITLYFADDGISAGSEDEYFVKKLDNRINNLYFRATERDTELEQKVSFFNSLVKLFSGDEIRDYERRIFQHTVRVSHEIKQWFDKYNSVREPVVLLLHGLIDKPKLNMNTKAEFTLVFLLTYSEETVWRSLSKYGDKDRMRVLLY